MEAFRKLDLFVQDYLPDLLYYKSEQLSGHTSIKIGGIAARFAAPSSKEQLILLSEYAISIGIHPFILGNGSNTIFANSVNRLIISTKNISNVQVYENNTITADCGANLTSVANVAMENSMCGLEFAHGIPGSVGGAVFMNAGAYGSEMKDIIQCATVYVPNNGIKKFLNHDLKLDYRFSSLQNIEGSVILDVTLTLKSGIKETIKEKMMELMDKRKSKQPLEYPSAGSFFKRPEGYYAGALIEESGLKGYCVGDISVSEKHAGFVINKGSGTFDDLMTLMTHIQDTVFKKYGVNLEPEVRIIH